MKNFKIYSPGNLQMYDTVFNCSHHTVYYVSELKWNFVPFDPFCSPLPWPPESPAPTSGNCQFVLFSYEFSFFF